MKNNNNDPLISLLYNLAQNLVSGNISCDQFVNDFNTSLLPLILDTCMHAQRDIYLDNNPDDYANGFYPRTLYLNNTPIPVNVPRTRSSNFFPSIIPQGVKIILCKGR